MIINTIIISWTTLKFVTESYYVNSPASWEASTVMLDVNMGGTRPLGSVIGLEIFSGHWKSTRSDHWHIFPLFFFISKSMTLTRVSTHCLVLLENEIKKPLEVQHLWPHLEANPGTPELVVVGGVIDDHQNWNLALTLKGLDPEEWGDQ